MNLDSKFSLHESKNWIPFNNIGKMFSKLKASLSLLTYIVFVNISTRLISVDIFSCHCEIIYLTKCNLTSMCYVLSWSILFSDKWIILCESQKTLKSLFSKPNSLVIPCNQIASLMTSVSATYSTLVVDNTAIFCRFNFQLITFISKVKI